MQISYLSECRVIRPIVKNELISIVITSQAEAGLMLFTTLKSFIYVDQNNSEILHP